ncbi:Flp pilus assembly complex ATPase component TadA [Patescibacteria group bacterium]|nr:Flp pilus assembly complex ATPase component TadA [Patescibacteria group bacterium]MDE2011224.1 Flp pilus assembly complex ATPase component TadA [Patescibacteria group bacterium]MDE2233640.1 Flp pilus assembly complex ATPase component TadA [Patescibacteria group bacterium]
MSVLDILIQKKIINKDDAKEIKKQASGGLSLDDAMLARGIKPEDILSARGEFSNIPVRSVDNTAIPFDILAYIPEESAIHYRFAPVGMKDGVLEVGIVDPDNMEARDALSFLAAKNNIPYKIYLITPDDFGKVIEAYKGLTGEVSKALSELETELSTETDEVKKQGDDAKKQAEGEAIIIEDAPVVKIVATIVRYAVEGDASDVHIEHMRERVRVRFRVDGILNTSLVLPPQVHSAVVARIKVLSNMRLDEKRKPQDGRFSAKIDGRRIDFRVSTFPAYYGEKVVMRILDQAKGIRSLDELGMTAKNLELFRAAINKPFGLILITGPTGSGKSTTLYSVLNEIDREKYNVLSLEDPVEYQIEGVSQSQVRPEIGYDFSTGLRTTLRQDPDIIMVGEIRDKETAQLAVQAALTGHLVFSTLHTNTAAGAVPRLIDMGVDPYLIAPTLILSVAQRLVGLMVGGEPIKVEGSIKAMIDKQFEDLPEQYRRQIPFSDTIYKIKPTPECPKGTRGRMAVFEMFAMTKDIEGLILEKPTEQGLTGSLRANGFISMKEDALIKAFEKKIPFEEVNKL